MNDVKSSLITSRRIIFTPTVELKDELASTSVQITCYDKDGKEVKRVTSTDDGNVEDPDSSTGSEQGGTTGNGGKENGGSNNGGGTSPGSITTGGGDDNGGGDNGGGDNGPSGFEEG